MGLALTHGSNSAQNSMGIITLGLSVSGLVQGFAVPLWVVAASATATAAGMLTGGGRLLRTLGSGMYTVRPVHGFVSQAAAAVVILGAATTHSGTENPCTSPLTERPNVIMPMLFCALLLPCVSASRARQRCRFFWLQFGAPQHGRWSLGTRACRRRVRTPWWVQSAGRPL